MAKKVWERPRVDGQMFEANEYVAACITGTIQCVYPGTSRNKGDNGVYDDFNGQESGWFYDSEGKAHGICGNDATISFNGDKGTGYEFINGVRQLNRPIFNISGYESATGTYTVTWTSSDGTQGGTEYHHKGRLVITNIDNAHPNHS